MLAKYVIIVLAAVSASLTAKLDIANKDATINSAKALVAPVGGGTLTAAYPWISASSYTTVLHYWHYTGDSEYNDRVTTAILSSAGGSKDFSLISPGNDDQLWWGVSCMTATEYGIADLTKRAADGITDDWLQMAENVFDAVSSRWQTDMCGGIGWQVAESDYRNSITNGLAFQLAARLGRYTGDKKYVDWADKIFDWTFSSGLIDQASYSVYDGISAPTCDTSTMNREKWTYNVGVFLYGAAIMRESTGDDKWQQHLDGLIGAAQADFTKDDILVESTCESGSCNDDQQTFKATLSRWLALTSRLVPSTAGRIQPILDASAAAALSSCNDQSQCSLVWTARKFEGATNLGAQMAAVEITGAQLAKDCKLPMKAATNGAALTNGTDATNNTVSSGDTPPTMPQTGTDFSTASAIPTTTVSTTATFPSIDSPSSTNSLASTGTPSTTETPLSTDSASTIGADPTMNSRRTVAMPFTA